MGLSNQKIEQIIKNIKDVDSIRFFKNGKIVVKIGRDADFRKISNILLTRAFRYNDAYDDHIDYRIKIDPAYDGYTITLKLISD